MPIFSIYLSDVGTLMVPLIVTFAVGFFVFDRAVQRCAAWRLDLVAFLILAAVFFWVISQSE